MPEITCVMYHLVRNPEETEFPHVKSRRIEEFIHQIDYLGNHYSFITADEFLNAVRSPDASQDLPSNPVLLTFDDAYIDHYQTVFPILDERNIQGVFFAPARPVWHGRMLAANAIQVVLSRCPDHSLLVSVIDDHVSALQGQEGVLSLPAYHEKWLAPDVYNTANARYVKRMLQTGLPETARDDVIGRLFRKWVTEDEQSLVSEYYASAENLREMIASGMHIAPHSVNHHWMNLLPRNRMIEETEQSLRYMEELGAPTDDWIACYPYGGVSDELIDVCRDFGASCGFLTESGVTHVGEHDQMRYPRVDTDDLPHTANAYGAINRAI